ncbi:hypothetical protein, partial [Dialister succinatiphilus]|uniref:hypothetical protein n=1 Tax=Dialister succinatiphilus TaxID=487173 RepID=UPI004024F1C5
FPIRLGAAVFLTYRKLFAKDFLFGLTLLCFIATGNCFAGRFLDSARNDRGTWQQWGHDAYKRTADGGQRTAKKRGLMAPLFVIPYFSDV